MELSCLVMNDYANYVPFQRWESHDYLLRSNQEPPNVLMHLRMTVAVYHTNIFMVLQVLWLW